MKLSKPNLVEAEGFTINLDCVVCAVRNLSVNLDPTSYAYVHLSNGIVHPLTQRQYDIFFDPFRPKTPSDERLDANQPF